MNALGIAIVAGALWLLSVLLDKVLNPLLARRSIKRLLKNIGKRDPRALENPKNGVLLGRADCLKVKIDKGNSSELPWSEVEEVHAFKRDLFTADLICLAFKRTGKDEYWEIHEEMADYHDLLEILPRHLPEFTLNWFSEVAFPAFATDHRIVWRRTPNLVA